MEAVRAERAVQTMTQIMPRAGLLAVVAGVRRGVVVLVHKIGMVCQSSSFTQVLIKSEWDPTVVLVGPNRCPLQGLPYKKDSLMVEEILETDRRGPMWSW